MLVAYGFQQEYPAIGDRIARREPWTSGCIWLHVIQGDPSDEELARYFVELQHAGFGLVETREAGRYWVTSRQLRSTKAPLIIRHTVRVWRGITGAVKQPPLMSASGAPVPRPGGESEDDT